MVETVRKNELTALLVWWLLALSLGWSPQMAVWGFLSLSFWLVAGSALRGAAATAHPVALWLGWLVFALPFSSEPLKSLWFVSHYAVYAGVYFTAACLGEQQRCNLRRSAHIAAYGGALALFIVKFTPGLGFAKALPGALVNWVAAFAAAGFAGSIAIVLDSYYPRNKRYGAAACAVVALAAVFVAHSRGAFIGCVAGSALAVVYRRNWRVLGFCAAGVLVIGAVCNAPLIAFFAKTQDPFPFGRLHIWHVALTVMAHNPVTGIGAGCFERGYLLFNNAYSTGLAQYGRYALDAHSQMLNMAAENGVLAAVLFLALSLRSMVRGFEEDDYIRPLAMAGALLAHSFVDGIMLGAPVCILYFALLGGTEKTEKKSAPETTPVVIWTALGLLLCIFALFSRAGGYVRLAPVQPQRQGLYADLRDDSGELFDRSGAALLAAVPNPYLALARLDRALELNPNSALYLYQRGRIYDRLGLRPQAQADYILSSTLEPAFVSPAASLALLYAQQGKMDSAIAMLAIVNKRIAACANAPREGFDAMLCAIPAADIAMAKIALSRPVKAKAH